MTGAQYIASRSTERLEELLAACDERFAEILESSQEFRELRAERMLYAAELGRRERER